ncbi:MAG: DUF1549 and DUF1553 domain-containing protein [Verrucomicrobia bacterium]|nr:DUF1549 and DUF1553 domain-containing protein [Verrucomicrobiota bacterium]
MSYRRPESDSNWVRSPIDEFVLSRLLAAGLHPSSDADPRDLVRRIYFQLIGLPPTPQQVSEYVQDDLPDATERLVDRLLRSPQFGERWGRHWLDLARYADSNGLDENFLFREAWRYRNWVIDAVNADVPFDRFLLEQIAGDLLGFESIEQRDRQRIAAGFLVVGPKVLLGNDSAKQRMEIADEQIDTVGRSVLGMTLGCARCHDHKFDPIPTADYYALAGILTSTQVMEQRYMLNEQRVMEQLVGLGDSGDKLDQAYEEYWRELPKVKEAKKHTESALEFLKKNDSAGLKTLLEKHPDALAEKAKEDLLSNEARIEFQNALVAKLQAVISKPAEIPPRAMIPSDADHPADESIRLAGQFDRKGEKVHRGFLQVASQSAPARVPDGRSGRLELAQWLTNEKTGAGQLTARVLANRIWHHLIGRGLVRTVDNFGRTGETPSHPELLDFLARDLIKSGWSIKALVREIVLSRTFRMSSQHDGIANEKDPENRMLWRAHRRRLDPESLRDAMLAISGRMDLAMMKSTVWYLGDQATAVGANKNRRRTDFPCRSVYLPVIRNDLPELFQAFDFADPHVATGARHQTMAAAQGLFMLNDPMVMDLARATVSRHWGGDSDDESRLLRLFGAVLNGSPTTDEKRQLLSFVRSTEGRLIAEGDPEATVRAWSITCHAMFTLSRFQFLQ